MDKAKWNFCDLGAEVGVETGIMPGVSLERASPIDNKTLPK